MHKWEYTNQNLSREFLADSVLLEVCLRCIAFYEFASGDSTYSKIVCHSVIMTCTRRCIWPLWHNTTWGHMEGTQRSYVYKTETQFKQLLRDEHSPLVCKTQQLIEFYAEWRVADGITELLELLLIISNFVGITEPEPSQKGQANPYKTGTVDAHGRFFQICVCSSHW